MIYLHCKFTMCCLVGPSLETDGTDPNVISLVSWQIGNPYYKNTMPKWYYYLGNSCKEYPILLLFENWEPVIINWKWCHLNNNHCIQIFKWLKI